MHGTDMEPSTSTKENAYVIMMQSMSQRKKPPSLIQRNIEYFTAKDRLYNDVVEHMVHEQAGFPVSLSPSDEKRNMMIIINCLWYIDGSHHKIEKALGAVIPKRFEVFSGYNDYKRKRKAAPKLSSADLKHHASLLLQLSLMGYCQSWGQLKSDIECLAASLDAYASYLSKENEQQKYRQSLSHPVRQFGEHAVIQTLPSCQGPVKPCYSIFDQVIKETEEYQAIYFDESLHIDQPFQDRVQRHRFVKEMTLSCEVDMLTYNPGASLGLTVFVWRVPPERSPSEMMSSASCMHKQLESRIGEYHTRQMKREFSSKYCHVAKIQPHVLRSIYSELTLDASVSQNPAIDERMRQAILNEDPEMVVDLRSLNTGRPDDTFSLFFEHLEREVEALTAADERRHNVEHFSKYISVRDLVEQTAKQCPQGTPIPSESTVLFAFVPRNAYRNTAKLYKGRINLQHKVQTRQLRASHIDEHYCAAIFKYLREYAVHFRDISTFVCMDDKSKVDFGEPGLALASGVRGKKTLVPVTSMLGALDHDVSSKGSLTPSVCFVADIPENSSDSFYQGQAHVTLKDSVFMASNPFRHAVELRNILQDDSFASTRPYLFLYTDGGPDHRTTYGAVKLSLILLFKSINLDILIAARTAPGHSWANPAERIMSLLNLAYQNVALYRDEMPSDFERMLKGCNSMSEVRKKASKERGLQEEWTNSLQTMISLLNNRTERVVLKGKNFKVGAPASNKDVERFESLMTQFIDAELQIGKYTKNDLKKLQHYKAFIDKHCRERNYVFQVRKCGDPTCCSAVSAPSGEVPHFLPDPLLQPDKEHFSPFLDLFGSDTSEADMPSSTNVTVAKVAEEQQGCPNTVLTGQNVRMTISCYECGKPRCVYSKKALSAREERSLKCLLDKHTYSCGAVITPDGDPMQGKVFIQLQLGCMSPIEKAYYSAHLPLNKDICYYCGLSQDASRDAEALASFRIVFPVCAECKALGKEAVKRLPKK